MASSLPRQSQLISKQQPQTKFLQATDNLERVTLRLPIELNDWLDQLLKQGKRNHGQKVPKEIWVQAALELLKALPVDWTDIESVEQMRDVLAGLETKFQKMAAIIQIIES